MNYYHAREDADYDYLGPESGYRGHSHVVVCESDDGRIGYAYGNGPTEDYEAWEIEELCEKAEENLAPRERDWMLEAKIDREDRDEQ